jgi:hypothetical protein
MTLSMPDVVCSRAIDLGSLAVGGRLVRFPGGPLPALNLVKFN